jgi:chorismate mutase/prephenate dehydrogenase
MGSSSDQAIKLAGLRAQLGELDAEILALVARRQTIVTEIGRSKGSLGKPTRDYGQEKDVIQRAREKAEDLGLTPNLAEELMLLLIRASLAAQERDRVQEWGGGNGRKVLLIGGSGKMGSWLTRFLASQNFDVEIADPAEAAGDFPQIPNWEESPLDQDIIIVATPLRRSNEILEELARRKPKGIVFDIGSLKTPVRPGLKALSEAGVEVTSIHPMFGPNTDMLSGRHVIFVDVGSPEATRQARELFASTMVAQVEMDLESHDRLIAYILGLSHALNIAFFTALAESGEDAPRLRKLSSTTFGAQLEVARLVAGDNPQMYYEIQSLNDYGGEALSALRYAVERIQSVVAEGDAEAFVSMMQRGKDYLAGVGQEPEKGS